MTDNFDPTDLQGQEDAKLAKEERELAARLQEVEDFKWLVSDKRGRRILWGLLAETGAFRNPFTGDSKTFFRCGEMNVGQRYLAKLMSIARGKFELMIAENNEDDGHADKRTR